MSVLCEEGLERFWTDAKTYLTGTAVPLMDGTAAVGSSSKFAREDHVHPSDTSKQDKLIAGDNITIDADGKTISATDTNTMRDPATAAPLMDGTAAVGTSMKYAREDHVHPSDSSKQDTLVAGSNITIAADGKTISATDTTYTTMTQAQATAGTDTTGRLVTAKILHDTYVDVTGDTMTGDLTMQGQETNIIFSHVNAGVTGADAAGNTAALLWHNSQNLWIGAKSSEDYHHRGATYISAGWTGTAGNSTIYICVPTTNNNPGHNTFNNYAVWHDGNRTVRNNLTYNTSNTTNILSAYQGYLLNTNKMGKSALSVTSVAISVSAIAANGEVYNQSKASGINTSNYKILGIAGWNLSGTRFTWCIPIQLHMSGANIVYGLHNTASTATGALTFTVYILVQNLNQAS